MLITKIESMDNRLFFFFHRSLQCRLFDVLFPVLTHLGSATSAIGISALIIASGIQLYNYDIFIIGCRMGLSLAIAHLVVHITKRLVNRPRPSNKINDTRFFDVPICAYSFPSGHTSASFALAVNVLLWSSYDLSALTVATLVAFSRVYLGVHYFSDVLAGAVIGSFAGVMISLLI